MSNVEEYGASDMVAIPAGAIVLRDDRLKRTWSVDIPPFWICRYPVTQQLYAAITNDRPFHFQGDRKPAETVSWYDAIRFCNLLSNRAGLKACYSLTGNGTHVEQIAGADGYRLPTEAEWEYACRAGSGKAQYGTLDSIAWYKENSQGGTQEVGKKAPNAWGLHDMLGNVWEWCWDLYDEAVYGPYRVFRGGGWSDGERGCLASNRRRSHPTFAIEDLGFRLAR